MAVAADASSPGETTEYAARKTPNCAAHPTQCERFHNVSIVAFGTVSSGLDHDRGRRDWLWLARGYSVVVRVVRRLAGRWMHLGLHAPARRRVSRVSGCRRILLLISRLRHRLTWRGIHSTGRRISCPWRISCRLWISRRRWIRRISVGIFVRWRIGRRSRAGCIRIHCDSTHSLCFQANSIPLRRY